MFRFLSSFLFVVCFTCASLNAQEGPSYSTIKQPGLLHQEFIYLKAKFPQCHASTIAETESGLVAAWFGGTYEKHDDVGIWVARQVKNHWTEPVQIDDGIQDGKDYPCWNPVLFQMPKGPLYLFYKVGPSPSSWWGMMVTSNDQGKSWTSPQKLPRGMLGPVKNKPVLLPDGVLLCGSSTEHDGWRVHLERMLKDGSVWMKTEPLNDGKKFSAIQPTILQHHQQYQILCRSRQKVILESWSKDGGKSWSPLKPTTLPNPNSGIDAVTLKDGRSLLVYNHLTKGRSQLHVSTTTDGKNWFAVLKLEDAKGEFSYPAVIQTQDGRVHITYTYQRKRVKHVVLDPAKLKGKPIVDGDWPL